jgi:hypothetical protein
VLHGAAGVAAEGFLSLDATSAVMTKEEEL